MINTTEPLKLTTRDPVTALRVARLRRQAHDLAAQGLTNLEVQRRLNVSGKTIWDWLRRDRPTDEELAALKHRAAHPRTRKSGLVPFRVLFNPDTHDRLLAEAEKQDAPRTRIVDVAVQLYCDAMARARGEVEGPVNVRGYRL